MTTENEKTATAKKPEVKPRYIENLPIWDSIVRNDITLPLVEGRIKRGIYAGYVYPYPKVEATEESIMQAIKAFGLDASRKILQTRFQREAQAALDQYSQVGEEPDPQDPKKTIPTGEIISVNVDKFYQALGTGSCRPEKISELMETLTERYGELGELADILAENASEGNPTDPSILLKVRNLRQEIAYIQDTLEARRQKKSTINEDEDSQD